MREIAILPNGRACFDFRCMECGWQPYTPPVYTITSTSVTDSWGYYSTSGTTADTSSEVMIKVFSRFLCSEECHEAWYTRVALLNIPAEEGWE